MRGVVSTDQWPTPLVARDISAVSGSKAQDITIRGIDVLTVDDDRITAIRSAFDLFGLLTDIDAISAPTGNG